MEGRLPLNEGEGSARMVKDGLQLQGQRLQSFDTAEITFFSLAPFYAFLGVDCSFSTEFMASDMGQGIEVITYSLEQPLFPDLGKYAHFVQGVETKHWPAMEGFLRQVTIVRREVYFAPALFTIWLTNGKRSHPLNIYSLMSLDFVVQPYMERGSVRFRKAPRCVS